MDFETKLVKLSDWIYAIDQQMVRAFVLVGKKRALCIDAGVTKTDWMDWIRKVTDLPVSICLTHSDGDHTANLSCFDEAWVHPSELPYLKKTAGVHFQLLAEGDQLDLGGKCLTVLECPGHTPGSIALLEEREKILFSGDTVSLGPVYMFGEKRDMGKYLETLGRLQAMAEDGQFREVYPCHNRCPIGTETIGDLIRCAEGILDGSISGEPAGLNGPGRESVQVFRSGSAGIYFTKNDK